jgi:hypothetical protein
MKMNRYIVKTSCPPGNARLLRSHCSGAFLNHIGRATSPAIVLAVAVVLATGCSLTGAGFNARLISPITTNQQASNSEADSSYQPARTPAFNDFFGS